MVEQPPRASDSLMMQVNPDNILKVRNVLREQMEGMHADLLDAKWALQLKPCGPDPISEDATPMFQAKIDQVLAIHQAHYEEIREAVERLSATALDYGYTDDQIRDSFTRYRGAP